MITLRKSAVSPVAELDVTDQPIDALLTKEWLLTDTRGGYASSTVVGCNTRGYHGLLVGASRPPVGRIMALANCLETITWEGRSYELSTFEFSDRFVPAGHTLLRRFRRDVGVHFDYALGRLQVVRSVYLHPRDNTVALVYTLDPISRPLDLTLRPLVGLRDFHSLQRSYAPLYARPFGDALVVRHSVPQSCQLGMVCPGAVFQDDPQWWHDFVYRRERERGQAFTEDLWAPGVFKVHLDRPGQVVLWARLGGPDGPGDLPNMDLDRLVSDLLDHQREVLAAAGPRRGVAKALVLAADPFVVQRPSDRGPGTTIMAGFPWFADWGRDAFLSLPGLLLETGRTELAKSVLLTFAGAADQGMIPNCFDEHDNTPHYNSVDASLWFIHAAFQVLQAGRDTKTFGRDLLPVIRSILESYQSGTRFGIHADEDGLITGGDPQTQLTWMDGKCGDTAFTPRHGKAVEVNALWYNALCLVAQYCARRDRTLSQSCKAMASRVAEHFVRLFWNESRGYLNDTIRPDGSADPSLRPNQIFALSLPYTPPLSQAQRVSILETIERELLTPYGLRTLDRSNPDYRGVFAGPPYERDRAYHQGTVWPFLMGAFVEAYLKVHGSDRQTKLKAAAFLRPLLEHVPAEGCLGSLCEVFDGDDPIAPKGCFAQAWSVAELIRALRLVSD